ncbi:hypothetical protein LPJ79_001158 [Coemansia sp. RSA 1821]|nr:hypothetical protein LPJ79_001158 [Coemansia sp. RSA 1821]
MTLLDTNRIYTYIGTWREQLVICISGILGILATNLLGPRVMLLIGTFTSTLLSSSIAVAAHGVAGGYELFLAAKIIDDFGLTMTRVCLVTMALTYPCERKKARVLALFQFVLDMFVTFGEILKLNRSSNEKEQAMRAIWARLVFSIVSAICALGVTPIGNVVRDSGVFVLAREIKSLSREVSKTTKLVCNKYMLLLMPCMFSYPFMLGTMNIQLPDQQSVLLFNIGSLLALVLAFVLDIGSEWRKRRGQYGFAIAVFVTIVCLCTTTVLNTQPVDPAYLSASISLYRLVHYRALLYTTVFFNGMSVSCVFLFSGWVIGSLTNDVEYTARFSGALLSIPALGTLTAYLCVGSEAGKPVPSNVPLYVGIVVLALSSCAMYYVVHSISDTNDWSLMRMKNSPRSASPSSEGSFTAVEGRTASTMPPGIAGARRRQIEHRSLQADRTADIQEPWLFGKPVEYYFYPNSAVPVFCPTMEQFNDFESLVTAIEPLALRGGVCKIIPPRKWRDELERRNGSEKTRVFDEEQFPIMKPIVQHFNGSSGIFHQYNVEFHRKLKLAQFFQMSQDSSHKRPEVKVATASDDRKSETEEKNAGVAKEVPSVVESDVVGVAVDYKSGKIKLTSAAAESLLGAIRSEGQRARFEPAVAQYQPQPDDQGETAWADHTGAQQQKRYTADDGRALFVTAREYAENEELERIYWKNMLFQPPMYGADVLGTLFPPYDEFPAWNIRNLPGLLRQIGQRMPGVNDPYLYLGMWKATFAWHVEDMDLYSINYIHFGEPKSWYSIPIDARSRFEMSMQNVFANDYKSCAQFLRHKSFLLSPRFLASQGIPFNRVVQRAGEIILTFPLGYHAGFNHGFNCAESVNFALDRWLDIAWNSKHCECVKDSVTIDLMEWFGDARKERAQKQLAIEEKSLGKPKRSPRRHAAAAVATASAAETTGGPPVSRRGRGRPRKTAVPAESTSGKKRRPSAPVKSDRSPQKKRIVDPVDPDPCDPHRRLASLYTPVGACGGCLLPIAGFIDSESDNPNVVECVQCGLTVHSKCAALVCADDQYRCANCEMDTDQLSCALCSYQNGLLLPLAETASGAFKTPEFAHYLCASFIDQVQVDYSYEASSGPVTADTEDVEAEDRMSTRSRTLAARTAQSGSSNRMMKTSAVVRGLDRIDKSQFDALCRYCSHTDEAQSQQCFGAAVPFS